MTKKFFVIFIIVFVFIFFTGDIAHADCICICSGGTMMGIVANYSVCTNACNPVAVASCEIVGGTPSQLPNPLGGNMTPEILIGKIINALLGIVGSLALVMFVYGGFMWMLSAGNKERVQRGKDIIIWATVGLVVIFSSYALVRFVFKAFEG